MKDKAIDIGTKVVELERQLDEWFASNDINELRLKKQLDAIAALESELRFVHMNTHLKQKAILSAHQIHQYDWLRGYASEHHHHQHES